jgi:hypothetical protein
VELRYGRLMVGHGGVRGAGGGLWGRPPVGLVRDQGQPWGGRASSLLRPPCTCFQHWKIACVDFLGAVRAGCPQAARQRARVLLLLQFQGPFWPPLYAGQRRSTAFSCRPRCACAQSTEHTRRTAPPVLFCWRAAKLLGCPALSGMGASGAPHSKLYPLLVLQMLS